MTGALGWHAAPATRLRQRDVMAGSAGAGVICLSAPVERSGWRVSSDAMIRKRSCPEAGLRELWPVFAFAQGFVSGVANLLRGPPRRMLRVARRFTHDSRRPRCSSLRTPFLEDRCLARHVRMVVEEGGGVMLVVARN